MNYLVDTTALTRKGANCVISYLHHYLAQFVVGEKEMHRHADNGAGTRTCCGTWRGESCLDWHDHQHTLHADRPHQVRARCFGLINRKLRRTRVSCMATSLGSSTRPPRPTERSLSVMRKFVDDDKKGTVRSRPVSSPSCWSSRSPPTQTLLTCQCLSGQGAVVEGMRGRLRRARGCLLSRNNIELAVVASAGTTLNSQWSPRSRRNNILLKDCSRFVHVVLRCVASRGRRWALELISFIESCVGQLCSAQLRTHDHVTERRDFTVSLSDDFTKTDIQKFQKRAKHVAVDTSDPANIGEKAYMSAEQARLTCRTDAGTEKIMASLKIGFFSPRFVDVFFLITFLPFCRRYTFTKQSETDTASHQYFVVC
ncbi:hypothetical protein LSAT2_006545 [Lamellibrachia satsuma]|nr:hypothetical protein LSAT2_006545 [Lamellibrachia satsuma]